MQKLKTFLFKQEAFNAMPFGYSASANKMTQYADIVIDGHRFIKHPEMEKRPAMFEGQLSEAALADIKAKWKGLVVTAPTL